MGWEWHRHWLMVELRLFVAWLRTSQIGFDAYSTGVSPCNQFRWQLTYLSLLCSLLNKIGTIDTPINKLFQLILLHLFSHRQRFQRFCIIIDLISVAHGSLFCYQFKRLPFLNILNLRAIQFIFLSVLLHLSCFVRRYRQRSILTVGYRIFLRVLGIVQNLLTLLLLLICCAQIPRLD